MFAEVGSDAYHDQEDQDDANPTKQRRNEYIEQLVVNYDGQHCGSPVRLGL